jgi:hypothetical protein
MENHITNVIKEHQAELREMPIAPKNNTYDIRSDIAVM